MSTEKLQIETPEQVAAILERIDRERGRQPELREHEPQDLHVPPSTVRTWRHRGTIPFAYVKAFARHYGRSLDYLYFGIGETLVPQIETKASYPEAPPPRRFTITERPNPLGLLSEPEILTSQRDGTQYILLPKLADKPSAGNGTPIDATAIVAYMAYEREWWDRQIGIPYHQAVLMEVDGRSMEPDLFHGEKIIVDLRETHFRDDAIYIFMHNGEMKIKRIHALMNGSIEIKSSNPAFSPDIVDREFLDTLSFIGRPRHAFTGRPLL